MTRHEALQRILARLTPDDLALFTTGMISREAFNIRDRAENFYMLGSMGLLSSLGLGLALQQRSRTIWVVEGDGSVLMSLGTLSLIATCQPSNFIHIVLDNEAYESTGGQPSITSTLDLAPLAQSAGYALVRRVTDMAALEAALGAAQAAKALAFILAKVTGRAPEGLGRVSLTPEAITQRFAQVLTHAAAQTRNTAAAPAGPR